jgi:hypothetical protein
MWNIIIGIVFMIGGFSGELVLRGTESGPALGIVGIGFFIYGLVKIMLKKEEVVENENVQVVKKPENEINTNEIKDSKSESNPLPIADDDGTKETIRGMFMEEAYTFVSEKYNVSMKEAKKIVKEIKSDN